ncbi:MAG: NADH-quinone oxidoreductase subunit J [Opitutaceae bacterium]|nr:NADH-quinone oxidoreductase subunit J [Opitutaceae bacterium]
MTDLLFYVFSALTVGSALGVVLNKNAVIAALSFLLSLVGVAGLFLTLDALLLAVLTVLVYAGAVVALFLFITMLLDMQGGVPKPFRRATLVASATGAILLAVGLVSFHTQIQSLAKPMQPLTGAAASFTDLKTYGATLFTSYLLPVQIVGFLLLIAMLGVIVLSKRFPGMEDVK